jgi:hypothetical protein
MRTLSCLASEAGTTCSSAPTATRAPSRINLRQWKSWFGLTPYLRATAEREFPGCSPSSRIARFSSGDHRRRRWTDVMTSMGPMSGRSLGVVIRPVVLLSLKFSNRGVRSKRGQLHKTHAISQQPIATYPVTANNNYHGLRLINC